MLQNAGVLYILTCKCASRHSGVQFFDIKLQKVVRECQCFPHFDLQMCFAPQRRAIFEHRNFQNGSGMWCFVHFDLQNVLRATARAIFEHRNFGSELPKWLRQCGRFVHFVHFDLQMCFAPQPRAIFHLSARTATSAPAALARLLFEHQEPRIIEKTQRFATSLTFFAHVPSF